MPTLPALDALGFIDDLPARNAQLLHALRGARRKELHAADWLREWRQQGILAHRKTPAASAFFASSSAFSASMIFWALLRARAKRMRDYLRLASISIIALPQRHFKLLDARNQ